MDTLEIMEGLVSNIVNGAVDAVEGAVVVRQNRATAQEQTMEFMFSVPVPVSDLDTQRATSLVEASTQTTRLEIERDLRSGIQIMENINEEQPIQTRDFGTSTVIEQTRDFGTSMVTERPQAAITPIPRPVVPVGPRRIGIAIGTIAQVPQQQPVAQAARDVPVPVVVDLSDDEDEEQLVIDLDNRNADPDYMPPPGEIVPPVQPEAEPRQEQEGPVVAPAPQVPRRFTCNQCDRDYTRAYNLRVHIQNVHQ